MDSLHKFVCIVLPLAQTHIIYFSVLFLLLFGKLMGSKTGPEDMGHGYAGSGAVVVEQAHQKPAVEGASRQWEEVYLFVNIWDLFYSNCPPLCSFRNQIMGSATPPHPHIKALALAHIHTYAHPSSHPCRRHTAEL